jgi:hypothetical protein
MKFEFYRENESKNRISMFSLSSFIRPGISEPEATPVSLYGFASNLSKLWCASISTLRVRAE